MPVLIVAIGRRLDYPVNLAGAKLHLYVRYEDYNGKHFNVEPTVTEGFFTPAMMITKTGTGDYHDITTDWSNQPPLLVHHWQSNM